MVNDFPSYAVKLIYVYRINDPAHRGAVKVGEATCRADVPIEELTHDCRALREAARARIRQCTLTAGIQFELVWATPAFFFNAQGLRKNFSDKDVHRVLTRSGIQRRTFPGAGAAQEWFETDPPTVMMAIDAIKQGRASLNPADIAPVHEPIEFRREQLEAIALTRKQLRRGNKMLWNAKMRFGKTLCALQVVKEMQMKRTLILTHRPVVDAGWYEDFNKIFYDQNGRWRYGSRHSGDDFDALVAHAAAAEPSSYVFFASLQDLRGSSAAGGKFDKNDSIFSTAWDLIVVDEAHEGTQTALGKAVLDALKKPRTKVLHLSGTPFNIQDEFGPEETFTWDYIQEQQAKRQWEVDHPGDYNPYGCLPAMNIYTYDLGRLLCEPRFQDKEVAFNFREFFRTDPGSGAFVHADYVGRFLDLLSKDDPQRLYPYSNRRFRDIFRHTLWMVPGVKEAAALEQMLRNHSVFGFGQYAIVNVAGDMGVADDDEARRYNNALQKLNAAITDNPLATRTITLSCGRLTTGVSVPAWNGVLMLAGAYSTQASAYMQTIFRVQTPSSVGGYVKEQCYVFDFAPDRTLTILSEVAGASTKPGRADDQQRQRLGEFLNYCSVIALEGSQMCKIDANRLMEKVKKAYIEKVVRSGFEDGGLYNDELLRLNSVDIDEFNNLGKTIGRTKAQGKTSQIDVNRQGLDDEQYAQLQQLRKKRRNELSPQEQKLLEEQRRRQELKRDAIAILRGISIRMPLLIYGADIADEDRELTIDNFTQLVDPASWEEFMPRGVTKQMFNRFRRYYDPDIFTAAGKRIRQLARNADDLPVEQRIERIADIFATFRNPDKETVLTPWRVVNRHLSDTLGGYTFFNADFSAPADEPRFVDRGPVTAACFAPGAHLLEINSKSGLYPLYLAYNAYRALLRNELTSPQTLNQHLRIWDQAVSEAIFVVCKTPMAKSITRRTLLGFRKGRVNMWAPDDLINIIKNQPELFIKHIQDKLLKNVKINAIVGNPPYQENGGSGGSNDAPIFQLFCKMANKLNPDYSSLIIPSKWFAGGRDNLLGDFRNYMLTSGHVRRLVAFSSSKELFSNVEIKGGICYFLCDKQKNDNCIYTFHSQNGVVQEIRNLSENEIFIRDSQLAGLIKIIRNFHKGDFVDTIISADTPFGIPTNPSSNKNISIHIAEEKDNGHNIELYYLNKMKRSVAYIPKGLITKNVSDISRPKVYIAKAGGSGNDAKVLSDPIVATNPSVCSQTFIYAAFDSVYEALSFEKYIKTKFFRILVSAAKVTQDALSKVYRFVPLQDFGEGSDIDWKATVAELDRQLYAKYGLSADEVAFIERMIKPME